MQLFTPVDEHEESHCASTGVLNITTVINTKENTRNSIIGWLNNDTSSTLAAHMVRLTAKIRECQIQIKKHTFFKDQ